MRLLVGRACQSCCIGSAVVVKVAWLQEDVASEAVYNFDTND